MIEFKKDDLLLAKLIRDEDWKEGLHFFSEDCDFVQVGTWYYKKGKLLDNHVHNEVERTSNRTQEVVYVRKGKMLARIFDEEQNEVENIVLVEGDTLIILRGGHGYEILEDGTQILEVKNGPFPGVETDKRRF